MLSGFRVQTTGKWILAGEHAVLRGMPALVFPLQSRAMVLEWRPSEAGELELELAGQHGRELELLFWGVFEKACALKKVDRQNLHGKILISSELPVGGGLGASAALCVAVAKWFVGLGYLEEDEVIEFGRQLENLFHGESSGVDVAVASLCSPLKFIRDRRPENFRPRWMPRMYLSYSGERGVTSECVAQVKSLLEKDPERARQIDEKMRRAVQTAERALDVDEREGRRLLIEALQLGRDCFENWGLIDAPLREHMDILKKAGAIVTKPTGSGKGGFVLSYWERIPAEDLSKSLIPCF